MNKIEKYACECAMCTINVLHACECAVTHVNVPLSMHYQCAVNMHLGVLYACECAVMPMNVL